MTETRPPVSPLVLAAREAKLPKPWLAVVDGDLVRKLRCDLGLSQKALAEHAKVSNRILNRIESEPSARCMPYIAGKLAMALDEDVTVIVRELVSIARKDDS
jgi:predicted transcriptional regulator